MNKITIIAKREFLSRVLKKTFLLTTIGLPLLIFGFYFLIIYFSVKGGDDTLKIAIADKAQVFKGKLENKDDVKFTFVQDEKAALKQAVDSGKYDAYVYVPASFNAQSATDSLEIVSGKSIGLMSRSKIEDRLSSVLEQQRLLTLNITKAQLDSMKKTATIRFTTVSGKEESGSKVGVSYIVGFASGFLIYMILFIYGTMVMRGVMEEKTNRIAEVIVSSVKPFQLMMGKIIGIGSVGLLQFLIWFVLVFGLQAILGAFMSGDQIAQAGAAGAAVSGKSAMFAAVGNALSQVNIPLVLGCFIFYFLGGYFLYSSLFAAVGCTVNEDPQEAQSLLLPVTLPIIFSMVIMTKAVNAPNSGLAVFGSIFPLTSPIVMMGRIAHGVPDGVTVLQLIISMVVLVISFLFTTWMAGKIYRTGILLYGKKASWKEMMRWAFRKA
jgi:ABC-2 type transport system permease protein